MLLFFPSIILQVVFLIVSLARIPSLIFSCSLSLSQCSVSLAVSCTSLLVLLYCVPIAFIPSCLSCMTRSDRILHVHWESSYTAFLALKCSQYFRTFLLYLCLFVSIKWILLLFDPFLFACFRYLPYFKCFNPKHPWPPKQNNKNKKSCSLLLFLALTFCHLVRPYNDLLLIYSS